MAEEMRFAEPTYSEQEQIRRKKLFQYQAEGRDPYAITRYDRTHTSAQILKEFDALEGKTVSIAGRMLSRRVMGKASFVHLLDGEGQIQAYVRRDDVGEEVYADFKTMDIGDILGIEGTVSVSYTHLCMTRKWAFPNPRRPNCMYSPRRFGTSSTGRLTAS